MAQHFTLFSESENAHKILDFITGSGVSVGERLPSEREMAEHLCMSRNTLREGLKILQTMGVVEIKRGSGVFVRNIGMQPGEDAAMWLLIHKSEVFNMLTVREALDLRAIELIPEEQYPEIRRELKTCVSDVRKTVLTDQTLLAHDLKFHNIIRRAAGNDILYNICVSLTSSIYDERKALFTQPQRIERSLLEHNQIANAFGSGNVNEIKQAYIAHLVSTRQSIELSISTV